jgi:hypothetical protein
MTTYPPLLKKATDLPKTCPIFTTDKRNHLKFLIILSSLAVYRTIPCR